MAQNKAFASVALTAIVLALLTQGSSAGPKKYDSHSTKQPVEQVDQQAMESQGVASVSAQDPEARFGFATTGLGAVGATSLLPTVGSTLRLDLGGVLLGAALGFGVVLLLPKLLHVLDVQPHSYHGYDGGYHRSEEGSAAAATDMALSLLSRVDAALSRHHVDSAACVQRAVCSQIRNSGQRVAAGDASAWDEAIAQMSSNSLTSFLLDGTSIKQAVELGREGGNCEAKFARCSLSKEALMAAVRGLLPEPEPQQATQPSPVRRRK
ncbi:uncharacterized protein LOC124619794 [Schistocerca americana]|uniref:uncharacterized protein LOC124619794 n=1 Tax=Schistocerca americana TaxID=7009 RepID=UPI001F5034E3|nr:uncharacterized protein LOC124619794 [Schistocerca americana]